MHNSSNACHLSDNHPQKGVGNRICMLHGGTEVTISLQRLILRVLLIMTYRSHE